MLGIYHSVKMPRILLFRRTLSDHIAQIRELLGSFPFYYVLLESHSHLYFTAQGDFLYVLDHIALIIELLGFLPKKFAACGQYSKEFFNKKGRQNLFLCCDNIAASECTISNGKE